jgi:lysophospholipase L1-like esterase
MKSYAQLTGLFLLFMAIGQSLQAQKVATNLNIVFIGNSITYGATLTSPSTQSVPVKTGEFLEKQPGIGKVTISNQGISGYTTVDFLPSGDAFKKVADAAKGFVADETAVMLFSMELGTNDSAQQGPNGAPVSPENFRKNLEAIASKLLTDFPKSKFIIHYPIYYSPNTYNGSLYLQQGLDRLQTYFKEIDAVVAGLNKSYAGRVFVGDKQGFSYFKKRYSTELQGEDGWQGVFYLHPNWIGASALGEMWGKAIYKAVK